MTAVVDPAKQAMLGKFARQTGADVPGVPKEPVQAPQSPSESPSDSQTDDIHVSTAPTTSVEPAESDSEDFFQDSFSDKTKPKPWENPKFRAVAVAVCVIPFFGGAAYMLKDGIPKPSLNTRKPRPNVVAAQDDSDKPKVATDGEWSSLAATNGMNQQFKSAAKPIDPNDTTTASSTLKGAKPGLGRTVPTGAQTPSSLTPSQSRLAMSGSRVPTDYDSRPLTHSYSSYTPPYRAPISSYNPTVYRSPLPAPVVASRPTVTVSRQTTPTLAPRQSFGQPQGSMQPQGSAQQSKSAQDRWLALATGTSAQNSTQSTNTGGAISPTVQAVAPVQSPQAQQPAFKSQNAAYLPSETAIMDGQPQLLIHRSAKAQGRLLSGIAFTPGTLAALNGQPIEIEITNPLDSNLPNGARLVATVDTNTANGSVSNTRSSAIHLVPTALAFGDFEIPIDGSAILITGSNGKPLIAKAPGSGFFQSVAGLLSAAVQGVGLANLGAGQTSSYGNGTYLSSIGANIGTTLLGNVSQRLQQSGAQQQSILILPEQTEIQINILKPLSLPLNALQSAVPGLGFAEMG